MNRSNSIRMSVVFLIVAFCSFGVASLVAMDRYGSDTKSRFQNLLETTLQARIRELRNYVRSVDNDLKIVGSISLVQTAINDFSSAFDALGQNPTGELQRIYIKENPHGAGSRDNLIKANDGSKYSELHAAYHSWFKKLVKARDYYDLFLVDRRGYVVYTVFKEDDLGTSLTNGPLKNTVIAKVYRKAMTSAPGSVVGSDFIRYAPSKNIPAAFVGTPVFRGGRVVGVLLVQLRLDPFNQIMQGSQKLGDTFESYLVNPKRLMLSQSRFVKNSILLQKADTPSVAAAISGATGFGIIDDYRGKRVLSAYSPFVWTGGKWAAVAEIDVSVMHRMSTSLWINLLIAGVLTLIGAGLLGWLLAAKE